MFVCVCEVFVCEVCVCWVGCVLASMQSSLYDDAEILRVQDFKKLSNKVVFDFLEKLRSSASL